jgi:phosphoenolpyruvate carboxylase
MTVQNAETNTSYNIWLRHLQWALLVEYLRNEIGMLWLTGELRLERPTPSEENNWAYRFFKNTIFDAQGDVVSSKFANRGTATHQLELLASYVLLHQLYSNNEPAFDEAMNAPKSYASLVEDPSVRDQIFGNVEAEYKRATEQILWLNGEPEIASRFPILQTQSNRKETLLGQSHALQVSFLNEHRKPNPTNDISPCLLQSMNCFATGHGWTG